MLETFDTQAEAALDAKRLVDSGEWPQAQAQMLTSSNPFWDGRWVVELEPAYHTPDAHCNAPKAHGDHCEFVPALVSHIDGTLDRLY